MNGRRIIMLGVLVFLVAPPSFGQVICSRFGSITDCSGPNGMSSTQVPFSRNGGVIITDRDTMPYTILEPQAKPFNPTPLPSAPSYGSQSDPYGYGHSGRSTYGSSYGSEPMFVPGVGGSGYGYDR